MKRRRPKGELRDGELRGRLAECLHTHARTQRLTENTISKGTLSCFLVNIKERDIVHFLFSVKESARNLSAVKKMNSLYRYTAKLPRLHTFHSLK